MCIQGGGDYEERIQREFKRLEKGEMMQKLERRRDYEENVNE